MFVAEVVKTFGRSNELETLDELRYPICLFDRAPAAGKNSKNLLLQLGFVKQASTQHAASALRLTNAREIRFRIKANPVRNNGRSTLSFFVTPERK